MMIPVYCAWCGELTAHRDLKGGSASYGGICLPCLVANFREFCTRRQIAAARVVRAARWVSGAVSKWCPVRIELQGGRGQ